MPSLNFDDALVPEQKATRTKSQPLAARRRRTKTKERDPAMPRPWLRARGSALVRWLDDPDAPGCPIPPCLLTFKQVQHVADIQEKRNQPMNDVVLSNHLSRSMVGTYIAVDYEHLNLELMMTSSLLCLELIDRGKSADSDIEKNPHVTDVAQALYTRDYTIESLRYVFVNTVVNHQTRTFAKSVLEMTGLSRALWEFGSREYEEMLGTRIGRTVGYLVLGAFPRGSHRIGRILVWREYIDNYEDDLHFRFDIEPIPLMEVSGVGRG
ncbi:hypothetical protein N7492_005531 [Penicillium capsulatum]|uniref:Uncharacterized protein n=1 Tax=Penicillium capsulatum TaxID=69766 RepID=A0A9W9IC41_9EURO|nr:hypothetical protein N7492_005531 [Penicillium capsulatum]KAJ6135368.1 hypothetical protein N7512_000528 [Penicillium capsulatum]